MHQSRLTYAEGKLTILDPRKVQNYAAILNLPDEILLSILDFASFDPIRDCRPFRYTSPLTLVCRRFHYIAIPFLYETVTLYRTSPPLENMIQFLHLLREKPGLRRFCRKLCLYSDEDAVPKIDPAIANEIVSLLDGVKTLEIEADVSVERWGKENRENMKMVISMIRSACQHLHRLESFAVIGGPWRIDTKQIVKWVNFPSLKKLELSCFLYGIKKNKRILDRKARD